jgi:hypothetical protein
LLELGAATTRPRWKDGGVELVLDHVTALAAGGICRLIGNERIPHPVEMTARLHSCIVMTEPDRPLFLLQGVSIFEEPPPPPKIHGAFNYYQNTDLVLAIVHRDEPNDPENYTFDFLTQHRAEQYIRQWYNELYFRPGSTLDWQSEDPPTLDLPHEVTTFDLLLEEYQSDSVDVIPGFHPAQVPSVPSMPALGKPGTNASESPRVRSGLVLARQPVNNGCQSWAPLSEPLLVNRSHFPPAFPSLLGMRRRSGSASTG